MQEQCKEFYFEKIWWHGLMHSGNINNNSAKVVDGLTIVMKPPSLPICICSMITYHISAKNICTQMATW
jgi:hypothetical protein